MSRQGLQWETCAKWGWKNIGPPKVGPWTFQLTQCDELLWFIIEIIRCFFYLDNEKLIFKKKIFPHLVLVKLRQRLCQMVVNGFAFSKYA